MKKARMNISHFRFILFNLKIFDEIVTTNILILKGSNYSPKATSYLAGSNYIPKTTYLEINNNLRDYLVKSKYGKMLQTALDQQIYVVFWVPKGGVSTPKTPPCAPLYYLK